MKNFKLNKFLSLIILILFFTNSVNAQQYFPVVAKFTQLPPYPIYLADFSNPNQTNLSIQIQLKDNQIASRPIRLKLYIEGQGFRIESTDMVQGEPAITLSLGQIYDLPNTQVANYFKQYNLKVSAEQYSRSFSEGTFRFGIEVIDFATNRPLSGVQWSNPVWIAVNEPPVWVVPANNVSQAVQNPQNVIFQWAPRHKNISDVEYEFTITELFVNENFKGNIQNLFLAQPPYYKVRTRATSLNYNAALPPLLQGRTYAYRVQAIAKRGFEDVGVFRNNGFSEIQHFQYGDKIKPPTQLKAEWTNNDKEIKFNWKGEADHKVFNVQYEEKGTGKWEKLPAQNATFGQLLNNVTIPNISSNKNYQLKVEATNEKGENAMSDAITIESNDLSAFVKVAGVEKDSKEYIIKAKADSTQKAVKKLEPTCDKPDILIDKGSSYSPEAGKELTAGNFKFMFAGDKKGVLQFSIPFAESLKLPVKKINVWAEMDDKAAFNAEKQLKEGMIKVTYNPSKLAELKRISDQIPFEELMGKGVGKKLDSVSAKINSYIAKGQVLCKSMLTLNDITANWKVYKNNLDTLNKLYSVKDSLLAAGIKNMKSKVEEKKEEKKVEKKEEKKDEKKSDNKEEPKKEDKKEEPKKEEKKEEKITQAEKDKIKEQLGALELRLKDTKAEKDNVNKLKKYVDETYKELETEIDNVKNSISAVKEEASRLKDLATGAAKATTKEVSNLAVKDNKDATAKVESTADKAAKAFDPEKIYNAGFLSEYSKKFKNLFEKKPSENAYKILSALFSQFYNGKIGNAKINFK